MPTGLRMGKHLLYIALFFSIPAAAQDSMANRYREVHLNIALPTSTFKPRELQKLPPNFYTQNMGFFCKQELIMTRKSIPVHFRLGSMEQCNYLERKPGYMYDPKHR